MIFFSKQMLWKGKLDAKEELNYDKAMESTLEKRVIDLEKQVAELTVKVSGGGSILKDWRKTVGMLTDDEVSHEADRLGREWREQQREP